MKNLALRELLWPDYISLGKMSIDNQRSGGYTWMNLRWNLIHNLFHLHLESMDAKVMLETRVRLSHRAGGLAFCRENLLDSSTSALWGCGWGSFFLMGLQGFPPITSQRWKSMVWRLFDRFSCQIWYTFSPRSLSTVRLAMLCHAAICSQWVWSGPKSLRSLRCTWHVWC